MFNKSAQAELNRLALSETDEILNTVKKYGSTLRNAINNSGDSASAIRAINSYGDDFAKILSKCNTADDFLTTVNAFKNLDDIAPKYANDVMDYRFEEGKYEPTGDISVEQYLKNEKMAEQMYNQFRNSVDDVDNIAQNTGWDRADIEKIKKWVFDTDVVFETLPTSKFPPDYEMAIAWERLSNGNFYDVDILLLKHELYESTYYNALSPITNCFQDEAHRITNTVFNWAIALKELGYGGD